MKALFALLTIVTLLGLTVAQISPNNEVSNRLWYQLEEEKLAFEFYTAMYAKWDLPAFQNISKCEEKHMKILQGMIKDFGDPAIIDLKGPGKYFHPELNAFYKEIMEKGNKSLNDALIVAGHLEERDIDDLETLMAMQESENFRECVQGLFDVTKKHLNLMVCHLKHRNIEFKPEYLSVMKYIDCVDPSSMDLSGQSPDCTTKKDCPYDQSE